MRLGIMQPYFFPYIGYISLIKHTDKFILFDTPQFIRHGWIERNRILKQNGGWNYISVPLVKHSQKTKISEIKINNSIDWKNKIISQLVYYKKSPYYYEILKMVNRIFENEYESIVELDKIVLENICQYLNIYTEIEVYSKMNLDIDEVKKADEWALEICKVIAGADEYWNPPGGKEFFDIEKYQKAGIDIKFPKMNLREYMQNGDSYEQGLSIIDVMMFNSPDIINTMMNDFYFI